jgi:hypothetical protein
MKLNRLETHDRLIAFKKDQSQNIFKGAEDCLKKNPDSLAMQERCHYVYIFAHPRTADDGVTKIMLWQPRLTKPQVQTNSYLFRALSHTDIVEVCWLLPPEELWEQYEIDNVTEHKDVIWFIHQFMYQRELMQRSDPDDISEERAKNIWDEIIANKKYDKMMKKTYGQEIVK